MDSLSPESRALYEILMADTPELYESKFAAYKKAKLDAVKQFVCDSVAPTSTASLHAPSSAVPTTTLAASYEVIPELAASAVSDKALAVDATSISTLPPTACSTNCPGSDFGASFLASLANYATPSTKPRPTAAATLGPAFTVQIQMSSSTSALATIGMDDNLAAKVLWVRNNMFSTNPVPSEAPIVKQQEQILRPLPRPSFRYNSDGVDPQEPCSEFEVSWLREHMQHWRPPDGAYSWVCLIGQRAQILFMEILVQVASRQSVGVCSFLRTSDQEEKLTAIFAAGSQARRLCSVGLRPWPHYVMHFIEPCSFWPYMQSVGANGRLSSGEKFSTTTVLFLPRDTIKLQPWPPPPIWPTPAAQNQKHRWIQHSFTAAVHTCFNRIQHTVLVRRLFHICQTTTDEDYGLLVSEPAKKYAIIKELDHPVILKDGTFVLQFEVRLQNGLECGGAYLKYIRVQDAGLDTKEFDNDTPYTVMFGPDKCCSTNKVHFILKHKKPKTGEYVEHHLKSPPSVPYDKLSHIYTAILKPDNELRILIDGEEKSKANFLSADDFEPALIPSKTIPDPDDKKPEDWDERAKIPDPGALIRVNLRLSTWKPQEIPNPEYFELDKPDFDPIAAIGIENWTMQDGILFDNILIADDENVATSILEKRQLESTRSNSEDRWSCLKTYRRSKGLCFLCGEQEGRDHQCKNSIQLHIVQKMLECIQNSDSDGETPAGDSAATEQNLMLLSAAASQPDKASPKSMQLQVCIQGHTMNFLLDSSSSTCFIDTATGLLESYDFAHSVGKQMLNMEGPWECVVFLQPKPPWSPLAPTAPTSELESDKWTVPEYLHISSLSWELDMFGFAVWCMFCTRFRIPEAYFLLVDMKCDNSKDMSSWKYPQPSADHVQLSSHCFLCMVKYPDGIMDITLIIMVSGYSTRKLFQGLLLPLGKIIDGFQGALLGGYIRVRCFRSARDNELTQGHAADGFGALFRANETLLLPWDPGDYSVSAWRPSNPGRVDDTCSYPGIDTSQVQWDPGDSSRDRLGGKPKIKGGGLSATILICAWARRWAGIVGPWPAQKLREKLLQIQDEVATKRPSGNG